MKLVLFLLATMLAGAAWAQPAPQMSPFEQALARKLSTEIDGALQISAALIATQQDLAKANARIKALEDKYEPKPAKSE